MSEKILVIDDHNETLHLTSLILKRKQYEVYTADSGRKGIEMARQIQPGLVLLDIMMPEMNGIEVCRRFRADPQIADIPIMMFTARSESESLDEAFEAGANEYVVKPTRPQELMERVQKALAHYGAEGIKTQVAQTRPAIGLVGARAGVGTTTVAINLAAAIADTGQSVMLVNTDDSAAGKLAYFDGAASFHGMQIVTARQLSAETLAVAGDARIVVDLGNSTERLQANPELYKQLSHVLVCFVPDLMVLLDAQAQLQMIESFLPDSVSLNGVMIDQSGGLTIPREKAEQILQYGIIGAIPIDPNNVKTVASREDLLVHSADQSTIEGLQSLATAVLGA